MSLPEVQINIQDPGLGIVPASAGRTQVKLGFCQKGTPNGIYSAGSVQAAKDALGSGPMLDAVAQVLGVAGGPVLAVPLLPLTFGTVTSGFTLVGSGSGTVTGSKGPEQVVAVKIITGGALATATFQVKVGSGSYGSTITTGADPYTYQVPGQQFTKLAFATGTYVANDVYTLNLDGTVTRTGSGTSTLLDGSTHSPVDAYDIRVEIVTAGALGVGAFRYSLDGENNWSGNIQIPAGGKYVIPGTGVVLTFAGTFTLADKYTGVSTGPTCSNTEITAAFTALLANPSEWGFAHVMVTPSSAANAATLSATVAAQTTAAQAAYRYVRSIVECPSTESDSTISAAFASFADPRVGVCVGDVGLVSPLTGRTHRRNVSWTYTARLSAIKLSTHPGKTKAEDNSGALKNVRSIYRDEAATPLLDEARFVTARTIIGKPGYFITRGRMMASPGSDFGQIMNCRVMDRMCTIARSALIDELNNDVRINGETGFIDERDAVEIESQVQAKEEAALKSAEDEISSVTVAVSRTDNLLSTSTCNVEISGVPKGYLETIKTNIGFKNPALSASA